jgi:hypothetical protein
VRGVEVEDDETRREAVGELSEVVAAEGGADVARRHFQDGGGIGRERVGGLGLGEFVGEIQLREDRGGVEHAVVGAEEEVDLFAEESGDGRAALARGLRTAVLPERARRAISSALAAVMWTTRCGS